jgi:DNA-3-methyladenine glycosylase I
MSEQIIRCKWCGEDPLYVRYHDQEWGVPVHDDHVLFEFLILEGAQAGLSWISVLRKREYYREAFSGFDPARIARYTDKKLDALMENASLIRNHLKIQSTRINARAFLEVQSAYGSFDHYLWRFVEGRLVRNAWRSIKEIPTKTKESDTLSKDLAERGFKFIGSTITYAYMQAIGMVNDHTIDCFRYRQIRK